MLRDNIYIHPPSFLFLCLWECDISIEGRRPGHRTEYSAHVFNVKTSPAGSCSIFPQSTWALCPKRWDFLCIHVTGCLVNRKNVSVTFLLKCLSVCLSQKMITFSLCVRVRFERCSELLEVAVSEKKNYHFLKRVR